MASAFIYTRSQRQNATSIYVGRIHLLIGVFVPHGMRRAMAQLRLRGALRMDVPTANAWFVANREAATSRQASFCWTSLSRSRPDRQPHRTPA